MVKRVKALPHLCCSSCPYTTCRLARCRRTQEWTMTRRSSFRCRRTSSAKTAGSRTAAKPPQKRPPLLPSSSCLSFVRTLLSMFLSIRVLLPIRLPFYTSPSLSLSLPLSHSLLLSLVPYSGKKDITHSSVLQFWTMGGG